MKNTIYMDNASTSFPKAPGVAESVRFFIEEVGCNINRGGYDGAYEAAALVLETRERLARLFHLTAPRNIIFTSGATQSLNMLVLGLLRPGDHALVSAMEHNALMRPLVLAQQRGVTFSRIPCDSNGCMDPQDAEASIRPNTRAIFAIHASNICGTLLPLQSLGAIAKAHGLFFIVDAAQTAGIFDISMPSLGLDAVVYAGHKGLLGPQGIGGMAFSDRIAAELTPVLAGGTGSISDAEVMPSFLPDKFEPGTLNLPGIYGLHAALGYLEQKGLKSIRMREQALTQMLHMGLSHFPQAHMPGTLRWDSRTAIVSVDFIGHDNGEIAGYLGETHGILTRCGLHCAPVAHQTLRTFPQGMVRFSPSFQTTEEEIERTIEAVREALRKGIGRL